MRRAVRWICLCLIVVPACGPDAGASGTAVEQGASNAEPLPWSNASPGTSGAERPAVKTRGPADGHAVAPTPEPVLAPEPAGAKAPGAPPEDAALDAAGQELVSRAARALAERRPEDVQAILAPLLMKEPAPSLALFHQAWADYNLARYGECVERMQRAVDQDPDLLPLARVLGFAHYKLGQYERARAVFEAIVQARPEAYRSQYGLGLVELTLGELSRAREHLERALALRPDYLKARFAMARLLHEQGREAEALPVLREVLERQPSHSDAAYLLSQVLEGLGREDEALEASVRWRAVYDARDRIGQLDRQLRAGQDQPEVFRRMAAEFAALGDLPEAARVLREGLSRHPSDTDLREALEALSP